MSMSNLIKFQLFVLRDIDLDSRFLSDIGITFFLYSIFYLKSL